MASFEEFFDKHEFKVDLGSQTMFLITSVCRTQAYSYLAAENSARVMARLNGKDEDEAVSEMNETAGFLTEKFIMAAMEMFEKKEVNS